MKVARLGLSAKTGLVLVIAAGLLLAVPQAFALDRIDFQTPGAPDGLRDDLMAASLLQAARRDRVTDPQDLFAAARAEYGRLLGALYAGGYYSGVIHVLIDGREAASIAPLDAPGQISRIEVIVDPGPAFTFSRAEIGYGCLAGAFGATFTGALTGAATGFAGALAGAFGGTAFAAGAAFGNGAFAADLAAGRADLAGAAGTGVLAATFGAAFSAGLSPVFTAAGSAAAAFTGALTVKTGAAAAPAGRGGSRRMAARASSAASAAAAGAVTALGSCPSGMGFGGQEIRRKLP